MQVFDRAPCTHYFSTHGCNSGSTVRFEDSLGTCGLKKAIVGGGETGLARVTRVSSRQVTFCHAFRVSRSAVPHVNERRPRPINKATPMPAMATADTNKRESYATRILPSAHF